MESSFTREEKTAYFKKKWRKEHSWELVFLALVPVALCLYAVLSRRVYFLGLLPVVLLLCHSRAHNEMMTYVEGKLAEHNA